MNDAPMAEAQPANGSASLMKWAAAIGAALLVGYLTWLGATMLTHSEQLAAIEAQMAHLNASITTVTADRYTGAQAALDREAERLRFGRIEARMDAFDDRLRAVERGPYGGAP